MLFNKTTLAYLCAPETAANQIAEQDYRTMKGVSQQAMNSVLVLATFKKRKEVWLYKQV